MNCEPINCNGNDLFDVLARLRERNCCPDKIETGIGGKNANYRVSYFESVVETETHLAKSPVRLTGATSQAGHNVPCRVKSPAALTNFERVRSLDPLPKAVTEKPSNGRYSGRGATPVTLNNFAGEISSTLIGHASATAMGSAPMKSAPVPVVAVGHTGNSFPQQGKTPASLLATVAVKREAALRNPLNDHRNSSLVVGLDASMRPQHVGAETVAVVPVAGRASLISEVAGKSERERQMEETPPDTVNPSILTTAPESRIQRVVVERGPEAIPGTEHSGSSDNMLSPSPAIGSRLTKLGENPSTLDSIETRLAALQSKLAASGKLKRSKTARMPYADL